MRTCEKFRVTKKRVSQRRKAAKKTKEGFLCGFAPLRDNLLFSRLLTVAAPLALALASLVGCASKPAPWFRDVAEETGLRFTHVTGATGQFYMPEIMGAGCALLDFDGDGDLDVFLVQGAPFDDARKGPGNRLFRNELNP